MAHADDLAADTLAVILAGGNGTRLDPLTRHVCKPALPFGAAYRSIDFSLSNCANSGIRAIGVPTQYKPQPLLEHLAETWRNDRVKGAPGVTPWRAEERAPRRGYRGTADAVYRNLALIDELGHGLVLILAGDHVYKMDYRPMLERHRTLGAAVTMACVEINAEDAQHFGVLSLGANDRIQRFVEKPRTLAEVPGGGRGPVLASMGVYVFDADFLARVLTMDAFTVESRHDFGADVLPRLIRNTRAFAYPFRAAEGPGPAYWRDIGTISAYWRAHMELTGASPQFSLDDADWPLLSTADPPLSITLRTITPHCGAIENSLVAPGCAIAGEVERSVLFRGVDVGRGAVVTDAVVLPGASVGPGCRLRGVIVDSDCRVPAGTVIERFRPGKTPADFEPAVLTAAESHGEDRDLALVG